MILVNISGKYRFRFILSAMLGCGWLFGMGVLGAGEVGNDDIFARTHADLVAILRVRDLFGVNLKAEGMLRKINPHTVVQNPVRFLAATFLHNNRLDALRQDAFFEVLFFDPAVIKGNPFVAAFPVSDGGEYLKTLSLQTRIREEGTQNNITTLREVGAGVSLSMYFGVTTSHIAVFGFDFDAVRRARDMYDQAHPRGMLWRRSQDVVMRINLSRLLGAYAGELKTALQQFRQDIIEDVIGEGTGPNHPLGRAIDRVFTGAQDLLGQASRLDLSLMIQRNHLDCNLAIKPAAGTLPAELLRLASAGKPELAPMLPSGCVSFQDTRLWPELWLALVRAGSTVIASGFGNVINQGLRTELDDILAIVRKADPREVADALVPINGRSQQLGPVRVKLIRWRHPEFLPVMLERFARAGREDSFLQEFLMQNRVDCKFEYDPELTRLQGVRVRAIRFFLDFGGKTTPVGFIGQQREYLVADTGEIMVVVTSPHMRESGREKAAQRIRLHVLGKVLDGIWKHRENTALSRVFPLLPSSWQTRSMLSVAGCSPLKYLQEAASNYARMRAAVSLRGSKRARQFAREFSAFKSRGELALMLLTARSDHAIIDMQVPLSCLQELARACLGISGTVDER